jgi:hypothetical protein
VCGQSAITANKQAYFEQNLTLGIISNHKGTIATRWKAAKSKRDAA